MKYPIHINNTDGIIGFTNPINAITNIKIINIQLIAVIFISPNLL